MLYRRNKYSPKHKLQAEPLSSNPNHSHNDGSLSDTESGFSSLLLGIPEESLLHITSNLDPKSLLALGRVCTKLCQHVKDDNTWHRAFARQFLGIEPEDDLNNPEKLLTLRPSETSWRLSFISRYKLKRRWELSHFPMATHSPLPDSPLYPVIHLFHAPTTLVPGGSVSSPPPYVLLATSSGGFITRSFPLTGKSRVISRVSDLLSPSSPCVLASDGGTGLAAYGSLEGQIIVVNLAQFSNIIADRVVVPIRSGLSESHRGPISALQWIDVPFGVEKRFRLLISGGVDGRIKLWSFSRMFLFCEATFVHGAPENPPQVQAIAADVSSLHIIVSAFANGDIVIWHDLEGIYQPYMLDPSTSQRRQASNAKKLCISITLPQSRDNTLPLVSAVYIDKSSSHSALRILVLYRDQPAFYRLTVNLLTGSYEVIRFGSNPSLGLISTCEPYFADGADGKGFILIGDTLGCISVYDWLSTVSPPLQIKADNRSTTGIIGPVLKFEAHEDASAITALAWNELVLATGTAKGDLRIWDGLSLDLIREFGPRQRKRNEIFVADGPEAHLQNQVRQIILGSGKDMMAFNVGSRIVGWWAGKLRRVSKGGVRSRSALGISSKKRTNGRPPGKGFQAYQLRQTISEEEGLLQEPDPLPRTPERKAREREQRNELSSLGLSEAEAVEYVLMLSRDEHERQVTRLEYEFAAELSTDGGDLAHFDEEFDFDEAIQRSPLVRSVSEDEADMPSPTASDSSLDSLSAAFSGTSIRIPPIQAGPSQVTPSSSPAASSSSLGSLSAVLSNTSIHDRPVQVGRTIPKAAPSTSSIKVQVSPRFVPEPMEAGKSFIPALPAQRVNVDVATHFPPMSTSASPDALAGPIAGARLASVSPPGSGSAWNKPLKIKAATAQAEVANKGKALEYKTSSHITGPPDAAMLGEELDDDLRFAIELSLAEARSREEKTGHV